MPPIFHKKHFSIFFLEKHGDREQREELESDLADVASQAEENPPSIPTENKEPTQNQDNLKEDISTETQQTISQPCPSRTYSGRGRPPKTTHSSAPKKMPLRKEKENAAQDAPGFQDDPSDADYTPSTYLFTKSPFGMCPRICVEAPCHALQCL